MGCCDKRTTLRKALAKADAIEIGLAQALIKSELEKAAGCPAGQHKHAPYDYCHPSDRKHRGYTDEEPSGGMDAAHGVLDEAVAEAQAIRAYGAVKLLRNAKALLDPKRRNPAGAAIALSEMADKLLDTAGRYSKSPNMRVRAYGMALKKIEKVIRSAAKKAAEEKPRMGGRSTPGEEGERAARGEAATTEPTKGHEDVQRMSDEELREHQGRLKRYIEEQERQGKEVSPAFFERGRAVNREVGRRAKERREVTEPGAGTEWQRRPGAGRANA